MKTRHRDVRAARKDAADRDLFFLAQAFGHGTDFEGDEPDEKEETPEPDQRNPVGPTDIT